MIKPFLVGVLLSFTSLLYPSWAEKTLQQMTQEEKIGQLFMVAAYMDREFARLEIGNPNIIEDMEEYITRYHVGGLGYVGPSTCVAQAALTNHYQELSKYPLLIAQDLEWGLAMRIKDGMCFPKNSTLGAIDDDHLIYEMGKEIGRQAKLIGVHMNLSPVLDVNTESENIAINVRSFGHSPKPVAEKGIAMIRGLQDGGIIASAKHFPGLGDITIDPHLGLPYSSHTKKRFEEVEFYPFVQAIQAGVLSIQTEHLLVPALEPDAGIPSSLSPKVVNDLLKKELGFTGLVLSGALRMKALTHHISEEEIVVKAFLAGSDMLLMPQDLPKAYQTLQTALAEEKITEQEVDARVLKILQMKERVQLDQQRIVPLPTVEELHSPAAQALKKLLYQRALTLVRNEHRLIPFSLAQKTLIAYVQLGGAPTSTYLETLSESLKLDFFILEEDVEVPDLDKYPLILLAVYPADPRRIEKIRLLDENKREEALKAFRVHGMSESMIRLAHALQRYQEKTIVTFFGNSFGLRFFEGYGTVVMAYETDPDAQEAAAQKLLIPRSLEKVAGWQDSQDKIKWRSS